MLPMPLYNGMYSYLALDGPACAARKYLYSNEINSRPALDDTSQSPSASHHNPRHGTFPCRRSTAVDRQLLRLMVTV